MEKNKKLADILTQTAKREALPKLYKYKMVKDVALKVAGERVSVPSIAARMIQDHIRIEQNHVGDGIEIMALILLSADAFPILTKTVAIGTEDYINVHPADVFSLVLSKEFNARGFILGHNHPSGSAALSPEDRITMEKFKALGEEFERPLRDFIVIGDGAEKFYSHRNESYEL